MVINILGRRGKSIILLTSTHYFLFQVTVLAMGVVQLNPDVRQTHATRVCSAGTPPMVTGQLFPLQKCQL